MIKSIVSSFLFLSIFSISTLFAADELFDACLKCDLEGVRKVLASGVDVNAPHSVSGQSSLAYSYHCKEVTKLLLESGADPNGGNYPALVSASSVASYEVMKMLLEGGADPNLAGGGEVPVFKIFQMTNCAACADLLFEKGAKEDSKGGIYNNLAGVFASYGKSQIDRKTAMGDYAKMLAGYGVVLGDWYVNPSEQLNATPDAMMKVLIKHGIDINMRTPIVSVPENNGEPAFFTAINVGQKEVIMSFLNNGADYNMTYPIYSPNLFLFNVKGGYTPLMYAAISGNEWLVEEILKKPDLSNPAFSGMFTTKDNSVVGMSGISAIYLAIMGGNFNVLKMLADSPLKWDDFVLDMKGGKFAENYGAKPAVYQFGGFKGVKKGTLKYSPSLWAQYSEQKEMAEYLESKGL